MRLRFPTHDYGLRHGRGYQDLKYQFHRHLIDRMEEDKVRLDDWDKVAVARYVREEVGRYSAERQLALASADLDELTHEVVNELAGFGPLEGALADEQVSDIMVNGARHIFIERGGVLQEADLRFIDDAHVLRVIRRVLAPLGRRLDEANPMVDARLPDGSRINAIIPPPGLGRTVPVGAQVPQRPLARRRPPGLRDAQRTDARIPPTRRAGARQHPGERWHGLGQDTRS